MNESTSDSMTTGDPLAPLAGLLVGISVSDVAAAELAERGLRSMHVDQAFIELARHLLALGASLGYGGDHRISGFTESLFDLIRTYDQEDKPAEARIRNYLAWPIHRRMTARSRNAVKDVATLVPVALPPDLERDPVIAGLKDDDPLEPDPAANRRIWARCLTAMRRAMNEAIGARILLGGRSGGIVDGQLDRFTGKYPGLVEEAHLAITAGRPVYLLGGFGGCTKVIVDALLGETPEPLTLKYHIEADPVYAEMVRDHPLAPDSPIDYPRIVADFHAAGIEGLRNGLSEAENRQLFENDDLDEVIALVLKGLGRVARGGR